MRAIRTTCVSFGFALVTAMAATPMATKPAAAAACADFFPFVCLFGPEAEAMQPAPAVPETWTVALALQAEQPTTQQPRRRRLAAARKAPVETKKEPAPIVEAKHEEAPMSMPLRLGPGPAFAMSLRLSPSMREEVTPPTSACVIEQTFNQLFPLRDFRKIAENDVKPAHPLMMVAVKTGTSNSADYSDSAVDDAPAPLVAAAAAQDIAIK